jgi:phosphatidate phosphatase APP1
MSVEVTTTALDARYNREPDKNGLKNVITHIAVIVTATNTETGQTESQGMEVPLKWARPSSFSGIEDVTVDMLQQWAEARIANDEQLNDYHTRLVKDLTKAVKARRVETSSMFGFLEES